MTMINYGACSNYLCRLQGCRGFCGWRTMPVTMAPQGCICPPTSEQTCQNIYCPRKNLSAQGFVTAAADETADAGSVPKG